MTGLDKILAKISEQAQQTCNEIDIASQKEARALWNDSVAQAQKSADEVIQSAKKKAGALIAAGKASGDANFRKLCLAAKNDIINDVIAAAYEKIISLDAKEYFSILLNLCASNCQKGVGIMRLNKVDLDRLPKDFEDAVNQVLSDGKKINIAQDAVDIENGFILSYGDIEINCTFRALFDGMRDDLKDTVCPILFADID